MHRIAVQVNIFLHQRIIPHIQMGGRRYAERKISCNNPMSIFTGFLFKERKWFGHYLLWHACTSRQLSS